MYVQPPPHSHTITSLTICFQGVSCPTMTPRSEVWVATSEVAQLATVTIVGPAWIEWRADSYVRARGGTVIHPPIHIHIMYTHHAQTQTGRRTLTHMHPTTTAWITHTIYGGMKGSLGDVHVLKSKPSLNPDRQSHRYDPAVFTHK